MSNALIAGVSGLQAHQQMLDVTGNNLANVSTYGYKASRVTFEELLSETMREATQPTATTGGTNPQQVGAGTKVASVDRNMNQGSLIYTGQELDMAIEGSGYFVLNDGAKDVFTRVGSFAVDAGFNLVDPSTGFRVQRIGSEGVAEGFQDASSNSIRIPYDVALPAKQTESITFTGNLSAQESSPLANLLGSGSDHLYTEGGTAATVTTWLVNLDQATGLADGETVRIHGKDPLGNDVDTTFTIQDNAGAHSTVGDLLDAITAAFSAGAGNPGARATLESGEIRLRDLQTGYSQTDLYLDYQGAGTLTLPSFFRVYQAGCEAYRTANVEVFDAQGIGHNMSVIFARTDTANTWDAVLAHVTGDATLTADGRRILGLTFNRDGSFGGLAIQPSGVPDEQTFAVTFANQAGNTQTVTLDLGTPGSFDGLSQFGGKSTVAATYQDGYKAGYLSSLSVGRDGILVGMFDNGVRRNVASIKLATFQNPAGLLALGGGLFAASANSGDALPTQGLAGGAGAVIGGSLEKSNVDMASEFVNLIQAQNGYQASARTIRVANDMLRELATLIR